VNIALSVILCILAVWIGHLIAAQMNDHVAQIAQVEIEEEA
jgi:CrcB protein